jgi:murein DD-endopeptidase MepM/ murein hydrolase activator NlpD
MSNQKKNFSARGYYIALVLCAAAIGVSGYLYYRGTGEEAQPAVAEQVQQESNVPAVATKPGTVLPEATEVPQTTQAPAGKPARTAAPLEGELVAPYSMECLSYNETTRDWRVHAGCDLAAEVGTPVKAAADGEVYTVYEDDSMGTTVVIRHQGGYTTHYASLAEDVPVKAGDKVTLGQTIGTVGSTALMESALGDHVCFRVTLDGDVIDPAEFLS